jgi:hypothetical protein
MVVLTDTVRSDMKIPFSAQYIYRVPRAAEMSNHLARIDRLPKSIVPVKLLPASNLTFVMPCSANWWSYFTML